MSTEKEQMELPKKNGLPMAVRDHLLSQLLTQTAATVALNNTIQFFCTTEQIKNLLNTIQYQFRDKTLLFSALTHKSFANELKQFELCNNEKLEFLGDTVLSTAISTTLYKLHANENEGQLSKLRGSIVNEAGLEKLAVAIGLPACLLLGKGEAKNGGSRKSGLLADAFEALLGAIFLDSNYNTTSEVIAVILTAFEAQNQVDLLDIKQLSKFDYKSQLQEKTMALFQTLPVYNAREIFDNNEKKFQVTLSLNGETLATTIANSKRKAEKQLAAQALKHNLFIKPERINHADN